MFYWDKAYRDPLLGDKEKNEYADKGIEAVDMALEMKPDYWEAIITKGLLYRVKAQVAHEPGSPQAVPRPGGAAPEAGDGPAQGDQQAAAGAGGRPARGGGRGRGPEPSRRPRRPAKGRFPRGEAPFSVVSP